MVARRTFVVRGRHRRGRRADRRMCFARVLAYAFRTPFFLAAKLSAWVSRELVAELRSSASTCSQTIDFAISSATLLDAKGRAVVRLHGLNARARSSVVARRTCLVRTRVARRDSPTCTSSGSSSSLYRSEPGGSFAGPGAGHSPEPNAEPGFRHAEGRACSLTTDRDRSGLRAHRPELIVASDRRGSVAQRQLRLVTQGTRCRVR